MGEGNRTGPNAPRFGFEEKGLGAEAVLAQLDAIAHAEDEVWADGKC
jgi:hypothetical protein